MDNIPPNNTSNNNTGEIGCIPTTEELVTEMLNQ